MLGHVILAIMMGLDHLNSGVEEISLALEQASLNLYKTISPTWYIFGCLFIL
jgi:hypothetical protein